MSKNKTTMGRQGETLPARATMGLRLHLRNSLPEVRRQLADAVAHAVAPDGLNADGFKLDFTGDLPRGSGWCRGSSHL